MLLGEIRRGVWGMLLRGRIDGREGRGEIYR
jgi:hypothetical protein